MPDTRYRWTLLRAGTLKLDGGSMFGLIPRVVWSKAVVPDDRHRITVAHNCLLLESPGGGRVLVEAGSGDKLDAKMRAILDLGDRTVVDAVEEVAPVSDVRHVVVSHLHFDHAGGLTRRSWVPRTASPTTSSPTPRWSPSGGCWRKRPGMTGCWCWTTSPATPARGPGATAGAGSNWCPQSARAPERRPRP